VQTLLGGRYALEERLGAGGMGIVYRAADRLTGQRIALKRLLLAENDQQDTTTPESDDLRLSLSLEFRTLASLHHPNVIGVLDYGFDAERQPFFTMELIDRPQKLTDYGAAQDTAGRTALLVDVLRALDYVHQRGIVHHDLKPANVLVDAGGRVRVLDFGLAIQKTHISGNHLRGDIVGTIAYMAPELFMEADATPASDLYAVGVMAYELFAGCFPYDQRNVPLLLNEVLTRRPDFSRFDPPLALVIERLMTKDPASRYPNAEAVIHELCAALGQPVPPETSEIRESYLQASTFVGRGAELSRLDDALGEALEGNGSAWLVGGESGVGKSRLLEELRMRALVRGALVLRGQGVSGGGLPYQLWRDSLRRLALSTALTDLEAAVLKELAPDISALVGHPVPDAPALEGEAARQRLGLTILDVFRRQGQPVVLLLEDLQWASESLEPLRLLNRFVGEYPWLIIGSYRDDEAPDLPDRLAGMHLMKVPRLSSEDVAALSASMLGEDGRQPNLVAMLRRETEGNTFFMVEVVRALAEEAGSRHRIGSMALPRQVVTGGIQAVLRRRLNRVPEWAQPALRLAAVIGRELELPLLARSDFDMRAWLTACANAAVLEMAEGKWRFAHDKLRDTVLADMDDDERRALNHRAAEGIEQMHPNEDTYNEVLAEHWYSAGDAPRALHYILRAVERMVNISADFERAQFLLERGRGLLAAYPAARSPLYLLMGNLAHQRGEYTNAEACYLECLIDAPDAVKIPAMNALSLVSNIQGRPDEAELYARAALEMAQASGDWEPMAYAYSHLAGLAHQRGEFPMATRYSQESLEIFQSIHQRRGVETALIHLGTLALYQGQFSSARVYFQQGLELAQELGDRLGILFGYQNIWYTTLALGDFDYGRQLAEDGLRLARDINQPAALSTSLNLAAISARIAGDYAAARRYFLQSQDISREINNPHGVAQTLIGLGDVAWPEGEYEEARQFIQASLDMRRDLGDVINIVLSLNSLAFAEMSLNDLESARAHLVEGLSLAQATHSTFLMVELLGCAAQYYLQAGYPEYGATLAGLFESHPANYASTKALRLVPLMRNLEATLPPEPLAVSLEAGKALRLEVIVAELLHNLNDAGRGAAVEQG
jgi:tetratricopeptide (TPR) repeat protein